MSEAIRLVSTCFDELAVKFAEYSSLGFHEARWLIRKNVRLNPLSKMLVLYRQLPPSEIKQYIREEVEGYLGFPKFRNNQITVSYQRQFFNMILRKNKFENEKVLGKTEGGA